MKNEFSRIITLLRKEKGITQKQAAIDLNITQSLLSHYEKGIRECSLDFVVKVSKYYNVSCDYLLGTSFNPNGSIIKFDDIHDSNNDNDNKLSGKQSILPSLNKKVIFNSLNIIFDMLSKSNSKSLINEVSSLLMLQIYKSFRMIYLSNKENNENLFSLNNTQYFPYCTAYNAIIESNIEQILQGKKINNDEVLKNKDVFFLNNNKLSQDYSLYSSSLLSLIQNTETKIKKTIEYK